MPLKQKIQDNLKAAMKSGDKRKVSVLRMISADIKNAEIKKKTPELADDEVVKLLASSAKKHEDSIVQFQTGGRAELAAVEEQELAIIKSYLPEELSREALNKIISETVARLGASGPAEFGKVMKDLMPKLQGRASGQVISELVKAQIK